MDVSACNERGEVDFTFNITHTYRDILQGTSAGMPGSAADAAIAAMICTSIVNCHSSGIGGGHFSVAYNRAYNNVSVINARERAPMSAFQDMFKDNPQESKKGRYEKV